VLDLDGTGRVLTGAGLETSAAYVLAAGDARAGSLPLVAAAVGEGAAAARRAEELLAALEAARSWRSVPQVVGHHRPLLPHQGVPPARQAGLLRDPGAGAVRHPHDRAGAAGHDHPERVRAPEQGRRVLGVERRPDALDARRAPELGRAVG